MDLALAVGGWVAFALAGAAALVLRLALSGRAQRVAQACHEVRGPLTAVLLGVESSVAGPSGSPGRLRAVESELERAAAALDDLQGVRGLTSCERLVDVESWLRDSVEAWQPWARLRGVPLRLSWQGPPAHVLGVRPRLAGATGNLIANAVEHGGGFVEVRARVGDGWVRIEVRDGGPGLSAPVSDYLGLHRRDRRRRMPAVRRGCRSPRGHGLAIVRATAAAHGGSLLAAPSPLGARLVLELPLAQTGRHSAAGIS